MGKPEKVSPGKNGDEREGHGDDHAGHGIVRDYDGVVYFFHCTQIADGSRAIAAQTPVSFGVAPGRLGRWEAIHLQPRS